MWLGSAWRGCKDDHSISFVIWMKWLEWHMPEGDLAINPNRATQFFASHFVCGLMAAAVSFYFVTFVAVWHVSGFNLDASR